MNVALILEKLKIVGKLRGREWYALCPNPEHEDHAPSWRIRDEPGSPRHGAHHCFACGFGGGPPGLVAVVLGCSITQARAWLGDDWAQNRELPDRVVTEVINTAANRGFRMPNGVDFGTLDEWSALPRRYALSRGIESWQVDRWGIGYAAVGRLAGRLVIPYRDPYGKPCGYTARDYAGSETRYLEPMPFEYPNRDVMFGEYHWSDLTRVYVCEGALNALAVERALPGVNVAAIAGSQLRTVPASKLARFGDVVILTDPDRAGEKAASQLFGALGRHCDVSRVVLREGTDPASIDEQELRDRLVMKR